MSKKVVDRRIQRTQQLLQDALIALILEKGFDAVTVQDIIDRANVGRSTFYAHYQDKEDLFLGGLEHLRAEFEDHLKGQSAMEENPWSLSLIMFKHAQEYRRVYKALVGGKGGHAMLAHIQKFLMAHIDEHLKSHFRARKKSRIPLEILSTYIVSSLTTLLTWWLDNDSPYSAEQMNDYYRQLVQPGVEAIMQ